MSLHYIVDAYNVIRHKSYRPRTKTNDPKRTFLSHIREERLCGSAKNLITVIFDGFASGFTYDDDSFEVVFSGESKADERIKRLVASSANPRILLVVSDDREIRDYAKIHGAGFQGVDEFLGKNERQRYSKEDDSSKPELTYEKMSRINRELRSKWLT